MGSTELTFELLNKEHAEELVRMYKTIFNKIVTADYFIVKYGLHLPDVEQRSIVALLDQEVVGFFGVLPQVFCRKDEELNVLYACDFFLHEKYRGKGVFKNLYSSILEAAKKDSFAFLYAYHSEQTFKVCEKFGWDQELGFSRFHVKAASQLRSKIARQLFRDKWRESRLKNELEPYRIETDLSVNGEIDKWKLKYDSSFFSMKKFWPRHFIKIGGCTLWLKFDYRITVGYLHLDDQSDVQAMIDKLERIARRCLIHEIVFHIRTNSAVSIQMKNYVHENPSFKVSALPLMENISSFSDFQLCFVDGDLF